jgi:magnesium transporter
MPDQSPLPVPTSPLRILYYSGEGKLDVDWPFERIGEALADLEGTTWVDILETNGDLRRVETLFRDVFRFHPLAIEDALAETHLPKVDDWGEYIYTVYHSIDGDAQGSEISLNEIDIFLGRNYLVTYHTRPHALLARLRENARRDPAHRLAHGPDRFLYELFDSGADDFMHAIEQLDSRIELCQDSALNNPSRATLTKILTTKRACLRLHRILTPQREVFNRMARDAYGPIDSKDRVYFRDVYDHMVRLHDVLESMRDQLGGALDTYLTAVSNRTNQVMKTLTIVNVLFLPMNFLTGFWGMNFFGDNIHLNDLQFPHRLIFFLVCTAFLVAPWILWLFGRWQKWF